MKRCTSVAYAYDQGPARRHIVVTIVSTLQLPHEAYAPASQSLPANATQPRICCEAASSGNPLHTGLTGVLEGHTNVKANITSYTSVSNTQTHTDGQRSGGKQENRTGACLLLDALPLHCATHTSCQRCSPNTSNRSLYSQTCTLLTHSLSQTCTHAMKGRMPGATSAGDMHPLGFGRHGGAHWQKSLNAARSRCRPHIPQPSRGWISPIGSRLPTRHFLHTSAIAGPALGGSVQVRRAGAPRHDAGR